MVDIETRDKGEQRQMFGTPPAGSSPRSAGSIAVRTEDGRLLVRSDAVLYTLRRLGSMWRAIAIAMSAVPRGLRDIGYDLVARIRYRVFGRAKTVCPLVPADLRSRFQGYTIAPSGTTKESS